MRVVEKTSFAQVAVIVRDIEETKRKYAQFFSCEAPETVGSGEYSITKTEYMGQAAPEAQCLMALFEVGPGLQIELIQPNDQASTWNQYLTDHGEGIHHIAFTTDNIKKAVIECRDRGMKLVQKGEYSDGSGRYAYVDATQDLKCIVELLESDQ